MSARRRRKRQSQAPSTPSGMSEFVRHKLRVLIPLLGSDKDGEVLAAAAAIRRMLDAVGLDLHDLTAALTSEQPAAHEKPASHPEPEWQEAAFKLLREHGECALCLTAWEKQFLSVLVSYHRKVPSASQLDILDNIVRKVGRLHAA